MQAEGNPPIDGNLRTGIAGLDTVLGGGFTPHRMYLVQGVPGAGKTTMAMQFLMEGVAQGETALYVTLSETEQEMQETAASHDWSLEGVHIHELLPLGDQLDPGSQYTMFHPSEVELAETTRRILAEVDRLKPRRVVFDSLSEIRLLSGIDAAIPPPGPGAEAVFQRPRCTVLLLDDVHQRRAGPAGA